MAKTIPPQESIPAPLRSLLDEAGYSINSLAEETGIPFSTLRRKMRDPQGLTMGQVLRLADALGVKPSAIIAALDPAEPSAA